MNKRRKIQSIGLLFLALANSLAELVSISIILPVLTLIVNPAKIINSKLFIDINDNFSYFNSENISYIILTIYIAAVVISSSLKIINTILFSRFAAVVGTEYNIEIFDDFLLNEYEALQSINSSKIVANIVLYTDEFVVSIVSILQLFACLINSFFIAIALFLYQPTVAFYVTTYILIIYLIIGFKTKSKLYRNSEISALLNKERVQKIQESVSNIREIKLGSLYNLYLDSYKKLDKKARNIRANNTIISLVPKYIVECTTLLSIGLIAILLLIKSNSIADNIILLGLFAVGGQKLLPLIQQSFLQWSLYKSTSYASNIVTSTILDFRKKLFIDKHQKINRNKLTKNIFEKIEFIEANFKYENADKYILNTFSLEIKTGEKIAIIGDSGQGKSTLLDLISGLLDPTKGSIKVDGTEINSSNLNKANWQNMIGYVSQTVILKDDSLIANIAFGEDNISKVDIKWIDFIVKISGLKDYVETLPYGLNTLVGERGSLLSGGQRQRVAIARALYPKPKILLLDEATSALDMKMSDYIINSLFEYLPYEITIILITHNINNLSKFERILEVKDGSVIEKKLS